MSLHSHQHAQPVSGFDSMNSDFHESKRMHQRVRAYWDSLKDNRRFPRESEINPAAIADVWDDCFLVDMRKGSSMKGFHYEYMGVHLLKAYGVDLSSIERCDASLMPHCAVMLRQFDEVAESGEPAMHEAEFENVERLRIKYRCCLLPLGGDHVDYILGCMRWKAY